MYKKNKDEQHIWYENLQHHKYLWKEKKSFVYEEMVKEEIRNFNEIYAVAWVSDDFIYMRTAFSYCPFGNVLKVLKLIFYSIYNMNTNITQEKRNSILCLLKQQSEIFFTIIQIYLFVFWFIMYIGVWKRSNSSTLIASSKPCK